MNSVLKKISCYGLRIRITAVFIGCLVLLAMPLLAKTVKPTMNTRGEMYILQHHYQVPVLVHKKDNPVLRLTLVNPGSPNDTSTTLFSELRISLEGSESLNAIRRVTLYYAGRDSAFNNLTNTNKLQVVGSTDQVALSMQLKGQLRMGAGRHYFWLSVTLHEKADLLHTLRINAETITFHGYRCKVAPSPSFPLRIGYAVRQHNEDSVHTCRIPGLATAKDGSLLAVYDARRESARDLQGHMDIGVSRSIDKGNSWLPMQVAIDMGAFGGLPEKFNGVSDACILVDRRTGTIFIAGLWMHGVLNEKGAWIEGLNEDSKDWNHQWKNKGSQPGFDPKQTAQFLLVKSTDNGKTWGPPVNLTRMCKQEDWWLWAPAPGQGITLTDGTLVFPTQGRDKTGKAFSNITYSKDGGQTWQTSNRATGAYTTENMAVELLDGSIMLNMRSNRNKTDTGSTNGRAIAVTRDLGVTWTEHPSSGGGLPEPTCMASIIRHDYVQKGKKRSLLLFSNPDSKTIRHRLTIKVSYDDGKTWVNHKKILLDEGKSRGYSCLTSIDNDTIGILYESSQADLVFQKIRVKELL